MRRTQTCLDLSRTAAALVRFALLNAMLVGCVSSGPERTGDVIDRVRSLDLLPRVMRPDPVDAAVRNGIQPSTYFGTQPQPAGPTDTLPDGTKEASPPGTPVSDSVGTIREAGQRDTF
jgi:hypothetical protein